MWCAGLLTFFAFIASAQTAPQSTEEELSWYVGTMISHRGITQPWTSLRLLEVTASGTAKTAHNMLTDSGERWSMVA
jgi:hypothetical protein